MLKRYHPGLVSNRYRIKKVEHPYVIQSQIKKSIGKKRVAFFTDLKINEIEDAAKIHRFFKPKSLERQAAKISFGVIIQ